RHERFGEILASFEPGTLPLGTDDRNMARLGMAEKKIVNPLHEGLFRTYQNEIHRICHRKISDGIEVGRFERHIGAKNFGPRISRSNIKFGQNWALAQFPCESAFPPAGSKYQYVHEGKDSFFG